MTEHATFGRTIRSRRRAKDLTLGYVARALGVSPSYVSMVERGKKPPFPESKLVILAQLLGIELGALRNLAVVARRADRTRDPGGEPGPSGAGGRTRAWLGRPDQ